VVVAETRADDQGYYSFLIGGLARYDYELTASAPKRAPARERWEWVPRTTRVDFRLEVGMEVAGIVLDRDGRPLAGAIVDAVVDGTPTDPLQVSSPFAVRGESGPDGCFRLGVGDHFSRVSARARGLVSGDVAGVPPGADDVMIQMTAAGILEGQVQDEKGNRVLGATVTVFRRSDRSARSGGGLRLSPLERKALWVADGQLGTDPEGRFHFADLLPGSYVVLVEKTGFRTLQETALVGGEATERLEITLRRGRTFSGWVRDADENPVPAALVVVTPAPSPDPAAAAMNQPEAPHGAIEGGRAEADVDGSADAMEENGTLTRRGPRPLPLLRAESATRTGADGFFRFDALGEGSYDLSVEARGFVVYRKERHELRSGVDLVVVLDRGLEIEGWVVSSMSGEPVRDAKLFFDCDGEEHRVIEADAGGFYRTGGLVPGEPWNVLVEATGYSFTRLRGVMVPPSRRGGRLDIPVDPSAGIRGRVVDASGEGISGANVRTRDRSPSHDLELANHILSSPRGARATTDTAGFFVIDDVQPTPALVLLVEHPDYDRLSIEPFAISSGELAERVLTLRAGAELTVRILDRSGSEVWGTDVHVHRLETEDSPTAAGEAPAEPVPRRRSRLLCRRSDAQGLAVFRGLEAGDYCVRTKLAGFQNASTTIAVLEYSKTHATLTLEREHVIRGVVVDSFGSPVPGVAVSAYLSGAIEEPLDRKRSHVQSDAEGRFELRGLGDGPYDLWLDHEGFPIKTAVRVAVDTSPRLVLERYGHVVGTVGTASGTPVTSFAVLLFRRGPIQVPSVEQGAAILLDAGLGERDKTQTAARDASAERRYESEAGAFELEAAPGEYVLEVTADGFLPARIDVQIEEGVDVLRLEVKLVERPPTRPNQDGVSGKSE
jgi:protocatechuate 3,4-dioxygenase beta subunit